MGEGLGVSLINFFGLKPTKLLASGKGILVAPTPSPPAKTPPCQSDETQFLEEMLAGRSTPLLITKAPFAEKLAMASLKEAGQKMFYIITDEFILSSSHGCIHIPQLMASLLSDKYNVEKGAQIIVHDYSAKAPTNVLSLGEPPKDGKARTIKMDIYPGSSIGILTYTFGGKTRTGSFAIQGGPPPGSERAAIDGYNADPTPAGTYTVSSASPMKNSSRYPNSVLPGGAQIRIKNKQKLEYRISPIGAWQIFIADTPFKKSLLNELLTNNIFRKENLEYRDVLAKDNKENWRFEKRLYYIGNDFGIGDQDSSLENGYGTIGRQVVFHLDQTTVKIHCTPFERKQAKRLWSYAIDNLMANTSVSLDKEKTPVHQILLDVAWRYDPKTDTLDISNLSKEEQKTLLGFIKSMDMFQVVPAEDVLPQLVAEARNIEMTEAYLASPEFQALKADFQALRSQYPDVPDENWYFYLTTIFEDPSVDPKVLLDIVVGVKVKPSPETIPLSFVLEPGATQGTIPLFLGKKGDIVSKADFTISGRDGKNEVTSAFLHIGMRQSDNKYLSEEEFVALAKEFLADIRSQMAGNPQELALLKLDYTDEEIRGFYPKPGYFGEKPLRVSLPLYQKSGE